MSNKAFPSPVLGLIREGKLLGISFEPNGTGVPIIVSGQGVASVVRNSAGNFSVNLQNQFRSLVDVQASLSLEPVSTAQAAVTVGTGTAALTVTAGSDFPGIEGNHLFLTIVQGTVANYQFIESGNSLIITLPTAGITSASAETGFNAAIPSSVAVASGGGVGTLLIHSAIALSGGTSATQPLIAQVQSANATGAGILPQQVLLQILNTTDGTATDVAAAPGNLVNLELFVQSAGGG
jgi:hypothetical protein